MAQPFGKHDAGIVDADFARQLETELAAMAKELAEARADTRAAKVKLELGALATAGVVEVAARNPNVAEFIRHWEGRALKAERELVEKCSKCGVHGDLENEMANHDAAKEQLAAITAKLDEAVDKIDTLENDIMGHGYALNVLQHAAGVEQGPRYDTVCAVIESMKAELAAMTKERDGYRNAYDQGAEACAAFKARAARALLKQEESRAEGAAWCAKAGTLMRELAEARACIADAMSRFGPAFINPETWTRWEKAAGKGEG